MTPARGLTAVVVAVLASLVSWVALDLWTGGGGTRPPLTWAAPAVIVVTGAGLLAAGWPVRRWVRATPDDRPARPLDPIVAARTAVFAKAAAYGGGLVVGWYVGQGAILLPDLVGERRADLVIAIAAALAGVLLMVVGFVVQSWCRVPPDEGNDALGPRSDLDADG